MTVEAAPDALEDAVAGELVEDQARLDHAGLLVGVRDYAPANSTLPYELKMGSNYEVVFLFVVFSVRWCFWSCCS